LPEPRNSKEVNEQFYSKSLVIDFSSENSSSAPEHSQSLQMNFKDLEENKKEEGQLETHQEIPPKK